jgi:hypothetical protein
MSVQELYDKVTRNIIAEIEAGNLPPWLKPWKTGKRGGIMPNNRDEAALQRPQHSHALVRARGQRILAGRVVHIQAMRRSRRPGPGEKQPASSTSTRR